MHQKSNLTVVLVMLLIGGACIGNTDNSKVSDSGTSPGRSNLNFQITSDHPEINNNWGRTEVTVRLDGSRDVTLFEKVDWRLTRHWPSGYLNVSHRLVSGEWNTLPLSLAWRRSQIPMMGLVSSDFQNLYLVTYDAVSNIPSGRTLNIVSEGFDFYKFTPDSAGEPERVASGLPLGGLDTRVFGTQYGNSFVLCGANSCLTINEKGVVKPWNLDEMTEHEMIEIAFAQEGTVYALTRLRYDDNLHGALSEPFATLYLVQLSDDSSFEIDAIDDEGVPWGLTIESGVPTLRLARERSGFRALLQYEFSLMPFGGVMEFGSNNLEGRIAWSAVYYLNALISLVGVQSWLPDIDRWNLRERLKQELELIALLTLTTYPDLASKRYSIDREPILVALHVGRILQVISRAERYGIRSVLLSRAKNSLCETLAELNTTLEEKLILPDGQVQIRYRKGFPFWADGANVPYNYVSGIAGGQLEADCINLADAEALLRPILSNEFQYRNLPDRWRYWSGKGDMGWTATDGISVNNPTYEGNRGSFAHISYRSMDATSLILFSQVGGDLPVNLMTHFKQLIEIGYLYPFLNEALAYQGERVNFALLTARRFSRSVAPWELQSQVWALDSFVENN